MKNRNTTNEYEKIIININGKLFLKFSMRNIFNNIFMTTFIGTEIKLITTVNESPCTPCIIYRRKGSLCNDIDCLGITNFLTKPHFIARLHTYITGGIFSFCCMGVTCFFFFDLIEWFWNW